MKVRRLSMDAWRVAQDLASPDAQAGFRPVRKRTSAELRAVEIVDADGVLDPSWQVVLGAMTRAPVAFQVVASQADSVFHSDVVVYPSICLVVTERRTTREAGDGERVIHTAEGVVDVVLASHAELWAAVRRSLPPTDVFRAEARDVEEDPVVVSERDKLRLRALAAADHGQLPPLERSFRAMSDLDPRLPDMRRPRAALAVFGFGRHGDDREATYHQWIRGSRGLYVVRMEDSGDLNTYEVDAGHVAREFERVVSRLVGFARTGREVPA